MSGAVVSFVLLGDTRRATLRLLLTQCISTWWSIWRASPDTVDVRIRDGGACVEDQPTVAACDYVVARNAAGITLLAVHASPEFMAALSGSAPSLVKHPAITPEELVRELRIEVLKSLCSAVLGGTKATDTAMGVLSAGERLPADSHASRSVAVDVSFGAVRAAITLVLAPALLELLVLRPAPAMPAEKLSSRRVAIRAESTRVEAVLGSVEVMLLDLAKLTQGDVIVLDQPLGQAGYLTTHDGTLITKIVLGRTGAQRAVSMAR